MEKWSNEDEEIDLFLMYDMFREQFQDTDDPWVKETLNWWNECVSMSLWQAPSPFTQLFRRVFPKPTDSGNNPHDLRDMEGPSMRELIEMERHARAAQVTMPATST
jgi:hypothetical protein